MEGIQKQVIEALAFSKRDRELEREDTRQLFVRAQEMMKHGEVASRYLIIWGSDDDTRREANTLIAHYESEAGACEFVLTDFFQPPPYNKERGIISLEVYPAGNAAITEKYTSDDKIKKHFEGRGGQTLFSIDSKGELTSPLDLVDVSIANTFLDACSEALEAKEMNETQVS
jgi:hypothetical protein